MRCLILDFPKVSLLIGITAITSKTLCFIFKIIDGTVSGTGDHVSLKQKHLQQQQLRQQQQQQQQQISSTSNDKDDLLLEIKRLRERIRGLESDNAALHLKMSRAQKDVDQVPA